MQFVIALSVLFVALVAYESLSGHQDNGWGVVVRPAAITAAWSIAVFAIQEFGTAGWWVGMTVLVSVVMGVKGYSATSAFFFVLMVSIVLYGVVLLSGQFLRV